MAKEDTYIDEAYEMLKHMSADEKKRLEYEAKEKAIRDYNSQMLELKEVGRKEGRKEGIKEGIKEGNKEGIKKGIDKQRKNTIKEMLKEKESIEKIIKYTGATEKEIIEIKKSM